MTDDDVMLDRFADWREEGEPPRPRRRTCGGCAHCAPFAGRLACLWPALYEGVPEIDEVYEARRACDGFEERREEA